MCEIAAKQNEQDFRKIRPDAVVNGVIEQSPYKNDLTCVQGKIIMESSFYKKFFDPTIKILINHFKKIYKDVKEDLKVILMVGGFSECNVIQEAVNKEFQGKCRVVVPN